MKIFFCEYSAAIICLPVKFLLKCQWRQTSDRKLCDRAKYKNANIDHIKVNELDWMIVLPFFFVWLKWGRLPWPSETRHRRRWQLEAKVRGRSKVRRHIGGRGLAADACWTHDGCNSNSCPNANMNWYFSQCQSKRGVIYPSFYVIFTPGKCYNDVLQIWRSELKLIILVIMRIIA